MAIQLETLGFAVDSSGVARGVSTIDRDLTRLEGRLSQTQKAFDQFNNTLKTSAGGGLSQRLRSVEDAEAQHQRRLEQIRTQGETRKLAIAQQTLGQLETLRQRELNNENTHQRRLVEIRERALNQTKKAYQSFGQSVGSILAVTGGILTGKAIFDRVAEVDKARKTLTAILGDAERANQKLTELRTLSDATPGLTRSDAITNFSRLRAVRGVSESTINKTLQSQARLSSVFTIEDPQKFQDNLVQLATGNFNVRDIREARRSVPIFNDILAKAFGTADPAQLRKRQEQGKITVDSLLSGIADAVNTNPKFASIQESIGIRFEKLRDRALDSLVPLGEKVLTLVEPALKSLVDRLDDIAKSFAKLEPETQKNVAGFALFALTISPITKLVSGLSSVFLTLVDGIGAAAAKLAGFFGVARSVVGGTLGVFLAAVVQEGDSGSRRAPGVAEANARASQLKLQESAGLRSRIFGQLGNAGGAGFANEIARRAVPKDEDEFADTASKLTKKGGTRPKSELELLTARAKTLQNEIDDFKNPTSTRFKLRDQISDLEDLKSKIEKVIKLRRELNLPDATFTTKDAKGRDIIDPKSIDEFLKQHEKYRASLKETDKEIEKIAERLIKNQDVKLVPIVPDSVQEAIDKIDAQSKITDILNDAQVKENATTTLAKILTLEHGEAIKKLTDAEKESAIQKAKNIDLSIKQRDADEFLTKQSAELQDRIDTRGDVTNVLRERRRLRNQGVDLESDKAKTNLTQAAQLDAFEAYDKAVAESTRKTEEFRNTVRGLFETLLDNPKRVLDQLKSLGKKFLAEFLTNITFGSSSGKNAGLFGGVFNGTGGFNGAPASQGGGGIFGGIRSLTDGLFGGGIGPGGTAPFNPNAGTGVRGGGGLLGGLIGGIFGRRGFGTFAGTASGGLGDLPRIPGVSIPPIGGGGSASGGLTASLSGLGASGLLAGGGFLGSLAGGKSQFGRLLGGLGGSLGLGAIGASGLLGGGIAGSFGALAPLLTNPITAVVAGALVGTALLVNKLSNRTEKALGKSILSEYGIKTQLEIQKQIKGIGDQEFRSSGGAKRNIQATIRLRPSKEALYEYALSSGQTDSKLVAEFERERTLTNPYAAANTFVKRAYGGSLAAGQPAIVGEYRPEVFVPSTSGFVFPSLSDYASRASNGPNSGAPSQVLVMAMGVIAELREELARLRGIPAGQFLAVGIAENAQALAAGTVRALSGNQPALTEFQRVQGF